MFEERAVQICTELIARRVVPREAMPDLLDEPLLQEEVKQRLADVGLEFVDKTGVPYVGVVIRDAYLAEELPNELGLDSRAMALILRCWMLLVAPHIYTGYNPPANLRDHTITETTLMNELRGHWTKTNLRRYISSLRRNKFLEGVYNEDETYCAGPMLWLAIDHDDLLQRLRKEGVHIAVERYRREEGNLSDHD
jgi:hypothetical protein